MIKINDISKVFRTSEVETVALNHVNLEVKEGEFVAIMGPSGWMESPDRSVKNCITNCVQSSMEMNLMFIIG